eukprot:2575919-Rhodomonas_salina.3
MAVTWRMVQPVLTPAQLLAAMGHIPAASFLWPADTQVPARYPRGKSNTRTRAFRTKKPAKAVSSFSSGTTLASLCNAQYCNGVCCYHSRMRCPVLRERMVLPQPYAAAGRAHVARDRAARDVALSGHEQR